MLLLLLLSHFSRVQLCVTPWTAAYQTPPSMGFSRQEYWSGLLFASLGDLPDPGTEPKSPALQADSLPSEPHTTHALLLLLLSRFSRVQLCVTP